MAIALQEAWDLVFPACVLAHTMTAWSMANTKRLCGCLLPLLLMVPHTPFCNNCVPFPLPKQTTLRSFSRGGGPNSGLRATSRLPIRARARRFRRDKVHPAGSPNAVVGELARAAASSKPRELLLQTHKRRETISPLKGTIEYRHHVNSATRARADHSELISN